jgi:2'-5' RNA ligase
MEYDYGAVLAETGWIGGWEKMLSRIDRDDVYAGEDGTHGLETDPHVTVLYGLHDEVHEDLVCRVCQGASGPVEVDVNGISKFESEEYDVLKLDVESKLLREMNKALRGFPYTNDYDEYRPHVTIGYLKKGKADKYIGQFSDLVPDRASFPTMKFQPSGTDDPIRFSL